MIRTASVNDLQSIVDIYNEAVARRFVTADLHPVAVERRREWFREHDPSTFPIYVFELDGVVLGWCSLSAYRSGREALIGTAELSYYVRYDSHGQGIGSALVERALGECSRLGKRVLFAILLDRNAASIGLMSKFGFELWGRLPDVAFIDGELVSHLYYGRKI
jgi:L-amino acid N-acyltransferase YncA